MSQNNNQGSKPAQKHVLDSYTVQPQSSGENGDKSPYYKSSAPSISLPKGGGALKGIDEKFSVNAINGTAGLSVPLPLTPGRGGFTPSLALSYNSGSGNSEFGLGWSLDLSSIQRKTDKKLPQYDDLNESDVFLLAGAEDLVPMYTSGGIADEHTFANGLYVKRYRPRIEGLFARIEFIKDPQQKASWWRVTTKENITTYYGLSADSRLFDPADATRVFKWLPELSVDNKGNVQHYRYKKENAQGVQKTALHEANRDHEQSSNYTNLYLKSVGYCNAEPYLIDDNNQYTPPSLMRAVFLMEAVLDYGEHADNAAGIPVYSTTAATWSSRSDAFSDFHAGFEIRTYRRCLRVIMFHRFEELYTIAELVQPELLQPIPVRSLSFTYNNGSYSTGGPYTEADFITGIVQTGYKRTNENWRKKSLPAMTMQYEPLQWNDELKDVSPNDMINAPQGFTGSYQWTDLWGEGLPGILTEQGKSWWYKSNLGDGNFTPAQPVASKPSFAGLATGTLQWQDLDADGRRQVVSHAYGLEGFFELDDDQQWQSFQPFKEKANIDWNSPCTKMLDLNGDGRPDVLLTHDRLWTWYENEGKIGFAEGGQVSTVFDEEKGPKLLLNDKIQSIFLADMNGDGMTDIVRIRNGEVCYWPNMGYGRFGAKVTMSNAPYFTHPELFNPQYLQLTDISGTGAADIVYIGQNIFRTWINLAGNAFGDAHDIATLPGIEPYSKVALMDFLGNGTGCIVWSSPLPQHSYAPLRYIDLMGGKKPYLMHTYCNGMGKTVSVTYKSSVRYYLEDKATGIPWATRLPFPVQCVDTITTKDSVSNTSFTQKYRYRHGYYDHEEREFRGFGRVDVTDTDVAKITTNSSLDQAPVLTRTWYHTGVWLREKTLLDVFKEEYFSFEGWAEPATQAVFKDTVDPQEQREAYRALKGSALRQEVYALDGSGNELKPYTVTISCYGVKRVQKQFSNRNASFLVYSDQSLVYSCERQLEDARLAHTLNLAVDDYGNVTKSAQVAYPRRNAFLPSGSEPEPVKQAQQKTHITYSVNDTTNDIGTKALPDLAGGETPSYAYRLRVPYTAAGYELVLHASDYVAESALWTTDTLYSKIAIAQNNSILDFSAVLPGTSLLDAYFDPKLKLLSQTLTLFAKDNNLEEALPQAVLSAMAIPYQQYTLAFTEGILHKAYRGVVGPGMLSTDGGYVCENTIPANYSTDNTRWWVPSGRVHFNIDPKLNFYTPVRFTDPWENETEVSYWGNYRLLPETITDALENSTRVMRYNWYNLQPEEMQDANENISEICYDALGLPVATAVKGKGNEADQLTYLDGSDFDPEAEDTLQAGFFDMADIDANAKQLLGRATWRCIYDLEAQPAAVGVIGREEHYAQNSNSKVIVRVSYSDGFGRVALSKAQCEPVTVNGFTAKWICSGKTIYNNKGKEVMQYEPFFCEHQSFSNINYHEQVGVSPKVFYDPLDRPYRTEMPDGSFSFTTWDNWKQTVYDANDTSFRVVNGQDVKSAWYITNAASSDEQKDAAQKAKDHGDTPTVMHLDTLARPFFTVQQHKQGTTADCFYYSYEEQDITGNRLAVHDANGNIQLKYRYNMLKAPCRQKSIDGGRQKMFVDVAGQPLYTWDADDRMFFIEYDALRRPVAHYHGSKQTGVKLSKTVYADGPNADATKNLRGKTIESYDGGGRHYVDAYDFKGQPMTSFTQLIDAYDIAELDWNTNIALSTRVFSSEVVTDALGRPVTMTTRDSGVTDSNGLVVKQITRHEYDGGGLLKAVYHNHGGGEETYVQDIHYDAKGQRQTIWYGNDSKTVYTYDPLTYRLTRIATRRLVSQPSAWEDMQDLHYYYDAVGNITEVRDDARPVLFYNNSIIEPVKKYTYDALYRLVIADGYEQAGTYNYDADNYQDIGSFVDPTNGNPHTVRGYTQTYVYDGVGNILSLDHDTHVQSGAGSYTRTFEYTGGTNLLETTHVTGITSPFAYLYDKRGNMTKMPHLQVMDWNSQNQLSHVSRTVVDSMEAWYQYSGGQRIRKVIVKPDTREERIYLGNYEVYRRIDTNSGNLVNERTTVHISDDTGRIAMLEQRTQGTQQNDNDTPAKLKRFIYSNHLQSANFELDGSGNIISYEEYHPYGTTSYQAKSAAIKAVAKRYRFTGKERDDESGLNYHGARYYAPWLCRWVSVDPINSEWYNCLHGNPQLNLKRDFLELTASSYEYSYDNPINFSDLSGEQPNALQYLGKLLEKEYKSIKNRPPKEQEPSPMPKDQLIDEGDGDMQYQAFKVQIKGTEAEFEKFASAFLANPGQITDNIWATYHLRDLDKSGGVSEGDRIDIDILDSGSVRVVNAMSNKNSFQATFQTLKGHPEAGHITFTGRFFKTAKGEGVIEFTISNVTRQSIGILKWVPGPSAFGRFAQVNQWKQVMTNLGDFLGKDVSYADSKIWVREWNDKTQSPGAWKASETRNLTSNINALRRERQEKDDYREWDKKVQEKL